MDQFHELKEENPGTVLFFRMGDFYELFHDDAEIARDFDLVLPEHEMPTIETGGLTNMFSGINKAIDMIENRKQYYKTSHLRTNSS